jgi:hypothetical protein
MLVAASRISALLVGTPRWAPRTTVVGYAFAFGAGRGDQPLRPALWDAPTARVVSRADVDVGGYRAVVDTAVPGRATSP